MSAVAEPWSPGGCGRCGTLPRCKGTNLIDMSKI